MVPAWLAVTLLACCVLAVIVVVRTRARARKAREQELAPRPLQVHTLDPAALQRYLETWEVLQGRFESEPEATIRDADRLIQNVMRDRGFPTGDFGRVSGLVLLSPEQAKIVDDYRLAHRISVKAETDLVPDDDARRAVAALRSLFASLCAPSSNDAGDPRAPQAS